MKKNEIIKELQKINMSGVDWYFAEAFLGFVKSDLIYHLDKEGLIKLKDYYSGIGNKDNS